MHLSYKVEQAGWATFTLVCGEQAATVPVSYLHDSLRDLASGVLAIVRGAAEVDVVFVDEPGEHHLLIERVSDTRVHLVLRRYEDWGPWGHGSSDFIVVLECDEAVARLRGELVAAMNAIVEKLGEDGYRRAWQKHDFPTAEYEELRRA
jgi:hypothetical protein